MLNYRLVHYGLILCVGGLLFFPNLGAYALWDVDETHNAECAREMRDADHWIVPTFNFKLRTDKPALLYWLMRFAYEWFGVNEFAARFWSAVAGIGTMLAVYELGRRMFRPSTGLLAAVILGASLMFCVSSHAATPDALLILTSVWTLTWFYGDFQRGGRSWLIGSGLTTGLGFLAKGPVGLVLPLTVIFLFLAWQRQLRRLVDWRWLAGVCVFGLVALPWYFWVGVETKMEFIEGFFGKHNLQRAQTAFEGHGGSSPWFVLYHPAVLLLGFAPWSAFLGLAIWYGTGRRARADHETQSNSHPYRFLWCWIAVWFLAFTVAQTKLPNYVLPAYPAVALLTARFLIRWRQGLVQPSAVWVSLSLGIVALIGAGVAAAMFIGSGWIELEFLHGRTLPELGPWSGIGLILVTAAASAWYFARRGRRDRALACIAVGCAAFVGVLAATVPVLLESRQPAPAMAEVIAQHQTESEIRIGVHQSYQPGLVYYARGSVQLLADDREARILLDGPHQAFVVVSAMEWPRLEKTLEKPTAILGRYRNLTKSGEWLLVTNRRDSDQQLVVSE